jgi:hypothetical protein
MSPHSEITFIFKNLALLQNSNFHPSFLIKWGPLDFYVLCSFTYFLESDFLILTPAEPHENATFDLPSPKPLNGEQNMCGEWCRWQGILRATHRVVEVNLEIQFTSRIPFVSP